MGRRSIFIMFFVAAAWAAACTSALFGPDVTRGRHVMMWKHRDTGTEHNFIARVEPRQPGDIAYVGLFNGGDSLLREAWTGMNAAGFAIMNTASYNLAPDTAVYRDREGGVMAEALRRCGSVSDFEHLLDTLPKPLGVQANFGVIDAGGGAAYYETDDYGYRKYAVEDAPEGYLVRTNYSCSGDTATGYGYIRCDNAVHLLAPAIKMATVTPQLLTDTLSRSFYHSLFGRDMLAGDVRWLVDQDFIPRYSSSASIVVEQRSDGAVMWVMIGYPPCSYALPVTLDSIPGELLPDPETWRSPLCDEVVSRKKEVFPIKRGSGPHYIDAVRLKVLNDSCRRISLGNYGQSPD